MIRLLIIVLFVSSSLTAQNFSDTTRFDLNSNDISRILTWRFRSGDNPEWVNPGYVDTSWMVGNPCQMPQMEAGVHWLRSRILLNGEQNSFEVLILRFSVIPYAFEVFWDGLLIGKNGKVGLNASEEVPGNVTYLAKLARECTRPGHHILAIRFSNQHGAANLRNFSAILTYQSDWLSTRAEKLHFYYLLVGIYLTATFLSLALFLGGGRHRSFFLFAIFTLVGALYFSISPLNEAFKINIIYNELILGFRYFASIGSAILLNIFFIYNFNIPHKKFHTVVSIILPILIDIVQFQNVFAIELRNYIMMFYSAGLLIFAVKNRIPGSVFALFGFLSFMLPTLYMSLNWIYNILPSFDSKYLVLVAFVFISSIILSISRQIREQNRLFDEMKLQSHRLETQLLKSQIQPHFISNTLHSIKSWYREYPKKAEKLIQTLSDEFRIINKISSEKIIPITEEINLCKNHLEIMGSRRSVNFEFLTENIPENEKVPPLIFHTLIENGLTHAYLPRENGTFWLSCTQNGREIHFTLKNDGSQLKRFSQQEKTDIEEGLGLSYVKARLEESFPNKWKIEYGMNNGFWETNIHIEN